MADEDARQILRNALGDFDTPHLQKVIVAAYDRWNWDTGSDSDKDWFEIAEEVLKERGVSTLKVSSPIGNNSISFSMGNGTQFPVLTVDQASDTILGTHKNLKVTDAGCPGSMEHSILQVTGNSLDIGNDLKQAIIDFLSDELQFGSMRTASGKSLNQLLEDKAVDAVRNRL